MSAPREAQVMLRRAENDLQAARNMLDCEKFTDDIFGFHAQQAVEKLIKAWLWILDLQPPYTHSLQELFTLIRIADIAVPESFLKLVDLTDYAVAFRYSDELLAETLDRPTVIADIDMLAQHVRGLFD